MTLIFITLFSTGAGTCVKHRLAIPSVPGSTLHSQKPNAIGAFYLLIIALWINPVRIDAATKNYLHMVPLSQYRSESVSDEIALARSAAPTSISDHAEILRLARRDCDISVRGSKDSFALWRGHGSMNSILPNSGTQRCAHHYA